MQMVLPAILVRAIHIHRRDAEIARALRGRAQPAPSVFGAVQFVGRDPVFVVGYAGADEAAEVFIEGVARAVVGVKVRFEVLARCSNTVRRLRVASGWGSTSQPLRRRIPLLS
jgi:hypothetical protein